MNSTYLTFDSHHHIDPRYPVAMAEVGGSAIRLTKQTEQQLIHEAADYGVHLSTIRNWDEYYYAILAATADDHDPKHRLAVAACVLNRYCPDLTSVVSGAR